MTGSIFTWKREMRYLIFALLLPASAVCQNRDPGYLVVRGRAEIQVPVDFVEMSVMLTSSDSSLQAANDSNRVQIFRLFETLKRYAINDSDFQTRSNSAGRSEYTRESRGPFRVSYDGILILRNLGAYDSLFQELVSLGNISVGIVHFGSNSHTLYRMRAYQRAVLNARREADMLLMGTKQKAGRIIKLIQDSRDVFSRYDDIEKLSDGTIVPLIPKISDPVPGESTLRKSTFPESVEVTVIFALE